MTRKQITRAALAVLIAAAVIFIVIFAVTGSVTASAAEVKKPVFSVDREDNRAAITFDCAWDATDTDELLEILANADVRATFFVTGEFCDTHPEAVRKMSAAGHSVQNHSDKNIHISGMNINDLIADTNEAARRIKTITGKQPMFFRPPYGEYDEKSLTTLEGMGYTIVRYNVDSGDLDDPDPVSVKKRVTDKADAGSIILFHNDCPVTDEALPAVITALKQKGLELVKIEDLCFTDSYIIDENGIQHYQPVVHTVVPVVYSDSNYALDSAFEKMRVNLTIQQIYDLSSVGRVALVDEIKSFLNEEELYAVREATYEELKDCYLTLVYAAENYGAGGTYTEPVSDEDETAEMYALDSSDTQENEYVIPEQYAEEGDPALPEDTADSTEEEQYPADIPDYEAPEEDTDNSVLDPDNTDFRDKGTGPEQLPDDTARDFAAPSAGDTRSDESFIFTK